LKKIFYSFLIFFVVLIVAIVFAANSSWVIKKAADKFAPEYNISYDDITGNVFTGVTIAGLKFDNKDITKNIKFSWNPSKILYKRVAINEISGEDLDVSVVKELIASFPKNVEGNSTSSDSAPLPVVITVDKVHLTVKPFEEQGVLIHKTVLDVEDLTYASDEISVERVSLSVDSNLTKLVLLASLDEGKLTIKELSVKDIDSEALESMFLTKDTNTSSLETAKTEKVDTEGSEEKSEEMNPLIPKEVILEKFFASLKPRNYKTAKIEQVQLEIHALHADIEKVMSNKAGSIALGNVSLLFDSNVSHLDLSANLRDETVTIDTINLKDINTLALQALFIPETNASAVENIDENRSIIEEDKKAEEKDEEVNHLIPKYIVLKSLTTQIVPASYDPVNIIDLLLEVKDVKFNIEKLMVEDGYVDLNGTTNLSNIRYSGKIKDNQIIGPVVLSPNKALFTLYKLPLRKEAIGDITIDINASKEHVVVELKAKAKHLLIVEKSEDNNTDNNNTDVNASQEFNVDIDSLLSHIVYTIADNTMVADTKIMISTPYAKDISVTNKFLMDKNISYSGEINIEKIIGIDAKMVKPLNNFSVKYTGDLSSVKTDIASDGLKGSFVSADMKKGQFHLETTEAIKVDQMLTLPGELNGSKVNVSIDVPLDFAKITPVTAKAKITSNLSNIDAEITYGEAVKAKITSTIPHDSLLKNFDKNVKWDAISPLVIHADLGKKDADLKLSSKALSSDIKYTLDNGKVDGKIKLGGLVTTVKGLTKEKIEIKANINSMEALMNSVQSLYTLEALPPVKGALNLSVDILKLEQINLSLSSPQIIYQADRETEYLVNDVKLVVSADKSKVQLTSYAVTYDEMKIFSTKPSVINIKEDTIEIAPLWLNDQLQVVGTYNIKTEKGDISADAASLHLAHKMIELDTGINIKTVLNAGKTDVKGKITLLGGQIHYDMGTKTYPSDSDIIVVQDMKKEEASPFMDNLSMLVAVRTEKPLIYKQGPIDIKAQVHLDIHKGAHGALMVLGEANILKGGSYTFEGKRFVLDRSNIYFTGDPNKPMLDISVKYKSLNHLITISISGTPATPNIIFSSIPSLKKEQILSIILFDSEGGAGTNSGEDMMKMMGGAMAKSALSNMGIKLDHVALGTDGSVEVGKKITDKIMFIYINDEIPQVRVKYLHSPRLESVISADEESEAYDIVYKRDMSAEDIMLIGR